MSNNGIVEIHGKSYMTVARRVELAHEDHKVIVDDLGNQKGHAEFSIVTECILHDPIVFKATITTKKGTFTGYSSVSLDTNKAIEKNNPYEVAETSAVGRALGFAGYGLIEGIASADEMMKGGNARTDVANSRASVAPAGGRINTANAVCWSCKAPSGKPHGTGCRGAMAVA